MAFTVNKFGVMGGQMPATLGRTYYVAPADSYTVLGDAYSSSDDNDGLDPRRALRTIDRAWNLVTANVGDMIILLPGTHTVQTTSVAADVAGVTMMGLPMGKGNVLRPRTILTTDITGDQIINVTAADIEIANVTLRPITASDAIDLTAAADRFYLHHFAIDLATPAVSTSTIGVTLAAANHVLIEDFYVDCDGAQGDVIVATGVLDSVIRNGVIQQSAGTWASAILCGAATQRLHIDNIAFLPSNATLTNGINGTGATIASGVTITNCLFADSVTVAADAWSAGEAELAENYQLGVGSTDGGVLITAIT